MLEGGKMGNCVPPACPVTIPLSPLCPGLLLQPWHSMQPCSCPHSRLQLTLLLAHHCCHPHRCAADMCQAGHSPVALGGDAAAGIPKAVGGWVDWHRDEGNAAHCLA